MAWLVIIDPLEGLNATTDTSLAFINKARSRGVEVDTATVEDLSFEKMALVTVIDAEGKRACNPLDSYRLIFMRKEPPYDQTYHYATQLLSLSGALVVNAARALRDYNEKLIALFFPAFMPPTLVSFRTEDIRNFFSVHGDCVLKSMDSYQGKSVAKLTTWDAELVNRFTAAESRPTMIQQFQSRVAEGDKRVLVLGGRFWGAVMRRPRTGFRANFASSEALPTELTAREKGIVDLLGPWLLERGIHFAGIDFIGEQLTEINITCPTGIVQVGALYQRDLAGELVDYFLKLQG
ncbi:MAG: hypothetical protein CSA20_06850 [Deltaproteobacteria bacterium]|nr:MAG: hypothetical protein CSA20_06850 [Deltaproteobacteria bacterium]